MEYTSAKDEGSIKIYNYSKYIESKNLDLFMAGTSLNDSINLFGCTFSFPFLALRFYSLLVSSQLGFISAISSWTFQ